MPEDPLKDVSRCEEMSQVLGDKQIGSDFDALNLKLRPCLAVPPPP